MESVVEIHTSFIEVCLPSGDCLYLLF